MGAKRRKVYEALIEGATQGHSDRNLYDFVQQRCPIPISRMETFSARSTRWRSSIASIRCAVMRLIVKTTTIRRSSRPLFLTSAGR